MGETSPASFCWFDYETFGLSPAWDRPAQFAAQRTDAELEPLGDPVVLYCRQSDDYLPHPAACRVTGLSPAEANARGLPEHRFIAQVRDLLGAPGTCSVGYNNVGFDDEFTRHTLWRNLLDPYAHEWRDGASRWDLLDVVRLTRALRPDGIVWPTDENGRPSNRLEHLATANGLAEGRAHDALVDVRATIAVARLIRKHQPRLYAHALAHRGKRALRAMLEPVPAERLREPLVLVTSTIPASRHHLALVVPIVAHPDNPNAVIVLDLARDPSALAGLDAEAIAARVFARGRPADHPDRIGLYSVATNRCPVVVPYRALRDVDAERLGIDRGTQRRHLDALRELLGPSDATSRQPRPDGWRREVQAAFGRPPGAGASAGAGAGTIASDDVDGGLYTGGFVTAADRARLARVHASEPGALRGLGGGFDDPRLDLMLFRYRARNHPDTLDAPERARWQAHVEARLTTGDAAPWLGRDAFHRAMAEQDWTPAERELRSALERHADAVLSSCGDRLRP